MSKQHLAGPTDSALSHQLVETTQGLDRSDQKYRPLFETINTGFALCQAIRDQTGKMIDCRFLELNPAFGKLTGVNPQEAVGKAAQEVFPGLQQGWVDTYQQAMDSGQTIRVERFIPGLDRWFELTAFFYGNDQFVAHYDDITARQQAQDSQRQSEASLQLAMDIAQLGTWSWNLLTNEGYLDARGAELIGLAPGYQANVAQAQLASIHPDDLTRTETDVMAGIAKGVPFGLNYRVIHPDQSIRHVRSRFHVITDLTGSPVKLMGTNLDVTVEYEQTVALRQSQEKQAFLLTLTDALYPLIDPIEIETTAVRLLGQYLGDCQVQYSEMIGEEGLVNQYYGSHQPSGRGQVQIVANVATDPVHTLAEREVLLAAQIGAYITVPLVKQERWVAILAVHSIQARSWTSTEVELVQEITERTWAALERARTQQALHQSEARLQLALDAAQMGTFVWYPQGDRGEADMRTLALYGLDPTDALNHVRGLNELVVSTDRAGHATQVARALDPAGDGLLRSEYRIHRASDGAERWIATLAQTQFAGEPLVAISITGVCADVTTSNQAAAALLEKEQRQAFLLKLSDALRPLSDSAQLERTAMQVLGQELGVNRAFFATIDADGESWSIRHDYTAGVASQVGRYPMSSFQRSRLPQWQAGRMSSITDSETDAGLSPADRAAYAVLGARAAIGVPLVKGGRFAALLSVNQTGPRAWTEAELALTREAAERTWVAIERAKAEEALHASQKRFESIANLGPDLLWDSAPDGATNWYNQRWLEYTGQRFEEAIGWGWTEAIHPDDREASAKRYDEAVEIGTSLRQEHRIRRHDGAYRWFVISASPLKDQEGQVVNMYGAATDIHDRKSLEAGLREADRRKDEFLAMLAHELRNPLAPIGNGLQILSLAEWANPELAPLVALMSRQLDHLVRLVDDLLDVSRITQGKIELKRERLELGLLVGEAVDAAGPLYQRRGQSLDLVLPPTPLLVDGDPTRLAQVVTNLLTNASRYTGEDGRVRVSLESIQGEARLRVVDNGIGLEAGQLEAIFELFVQVDNSVARSGGGLGLGLTLVRRLVELHGGRVEVRSAGLGQGSEFSMYLPLLREGKPQPAINQVTPQLTDQPPLLVIDDNADAALTLAMLLKLKGYQVHTRSSGRAGLEAAQQLRPAAILLDLGMPDLDGYETCRLLRQQPGGKAVPVIALTGYGQAEDHQLTHEAGFTAHLVKPVNLVALTQLLTQLLVG